MRLVLSLLAVLRLSAGEDPLAARSAALVSAQTGDWRTAESHQRRALAACRDCTPEDRASLRAELAGYLTLGGFPDAAIGLWKQSLAELPDGSRLRFTAALGLGVAYQDSGRTAAALKIWNQFCGAAALDPIEDAACRFNIAIARPPEVSVWSELEEILPILLTASNPVSRATALLQTARAADFAGRFNRAAELLTQADGIIAGELHPSHPFRAYVFDARAQLAARQGDGKQAKIWRKKATRIPEGKGWDRGAVSVEELKGKPR